MSILGLILLLILLGSIPVYPYSRSWGWGPSGLLGTILVIILIVWLVNGGVGGPGPVIVR